MHSEMKHLGTLVEQTYLPILRLVHDDPGRVEADFAEVRAQRERVTPWSSPRRRWQVTYGNFVREMDWAFGELEPHLAKPDFEDLVITTVGSRLESWIGWLKPFMARANARTPGGMGAAMEKAGRRMDTAMVAMTAPIVGEVEVRSSEGGVIELFVPDCAMHTVVSRTQPQTRACLYGCKAACEAFMADGPMTIRFEPNLPAFDCRMWLTVGNAGDGTAPGAPDQGTGDHPELVTA
jgi:hypothetical protein